MNEPAAADTETGERTDTETDAGTATATATATGTGTGTATGAGRATGAGTGTGTDTGTGTGTDTDGGADDEDEDERLLVPGNPPRFLRGGIALGVGALLAVVVMSIDRQFGLAVPLGALGVVLATFGVLDIVGSFDDPDERVARRVHLRDLAVPLGIAGGGALATVLLVLGAVAGFLPVAALAVLVPAAFLTAVYGVWRIGERLGAFMPRPDEDPGASAVLWKRHGFWVVVAASLLYLPMLGSKSLTDPWETHYGEVAREILSRNDWISLWWAQEGWFWSKPVLDFWMQALAMSFFGVRWQPGAMLSAAADGRTPWPEWAVRMPIFLLTLAATYLLYKGTAKVFGRRAGLLGALALLTMPQWAMVAHQTMTDMPFVGSMSAAMGLFLLGVHTDPERQVRVYEVTVGSWRLRLSLFHLVMGAIAAAVLPQIFYLLSRNLEIGLSPLHLRLHADVFSSGSPGNCGIPGNEDVPGIIRECKTWSATLRYLHPSLQALVWAQVLAVLLYLNWGERRLARLLFHAAWFFAALSTMAKGAAGFGIPILCALAYVAVTRRWRDLLRMELLSGLLILAAVALPWFVAMYARHGQPFTDRLLFHDMFKRAFTHVHDTNEGDDVSFRYYVWQLGYATFPWVGVLPAALVGWLRRRDEPADPRGDGAVFFTGWFVLAFALFSLMLTKFHHYILPAVPAAAMLVGLYLDELWRSSERAAAGDAEPERDRRYHALALGAAAVAGAMLLALVGRDLAQDREAIAGEARLLHLFTYNYGRPWPDSLELGGMIWIFTAVATVGTFSLVVTRWRRSLVCGLCGVALVLSAWTLDVYLVKASPHWGQRELFVAYHQAAREVPGPIIAYQMNWKGENFYMGNAIPAFVSSGKKFQDYITAEKKKGIKTFYFVTEDSPRQSRTGSLSSELGSPRVFDKLTTRELNNKFVLVRVTFE